MKILYGAGAALVLGVALAACGGGGGGGGGSVPSIPVTVPTATIPATTQAVGAFSTTATSAPISLAAISNGSSAKVQLPKASGSANASLMLTATLPTGATAPQALRGSVHSPKAIGGTGLTVLDYIVLTVDSTISIAQTPSFSFTLAQPIASGASAYVGILDVNNASAGWSTMAGPATVSGNTYTIASTLIAPPVTLAKGDTYVFALVSVGGTPNPPSVSASSLSYAGTKSVSFIYNYALGYPQPSPNATAPPGGESYNVTLTATTGTATPPPGISAAGLTDQHVAESDASNLSTNTYSADAWAGTSNGNVLLYGSVVQETSAATSPVITTVYGTPQTIDESPETNAASWTNVPTAIINYAYADTESGTKTIASDGTYADVETIGNPSGTASLTENADGSAAITGPFYGGGIVDSITMSAPSPVPAASPNVNITFNYSAAAQSNYGLPPSATSTDPVWYKTSPIPFYSETDSITTNAAVPNTCVNASYNKGTDVRRLIDITDTVIGDTESITQDVYNVDGVPVCMVTMDIEMDAYSFKGDTPYLFFYGPLGLEIVTTLETLVLQNVPEATAPSTTTAAMRTANAQRLQANVAAIQERQLATFANERAQRTRKIIAKIRGGAR